MIAWLLLPIVARANDAAQPTQGDVIPVAISHGIEMHADSFAGAALVDGGATTALRRSVIASGGGTSSGGAFTLSGTIGQPDGDPLQPSTGGVYAITGGFWPGAPTPPPPGDALFADGFEVP